MTCGCLSRCFGLRCSKRRNAANNHNDPLLEPLNAAIPDRYDDDGVGQEDDCDYSNRTKQHARARTQYCSPTNSTSSFPAEESSASASESLSTSLNEHLSLEQTHTHAHTRHDNYEHTPDEQLTDLQKLQKYCPLTTEAERKRFLNAKGGDYDLALDQLTQYLAWRERYDLDLDCLSLGLGINASAATATATNENLNSGGILDSNLDDGSNAVDCLSLDDDWHSCASNDGTLDEIDWAYASNKALAYEQEEKGDDGRVDMVRHNADTAATNTTTILPQLARILNIPGSDEHLCDHDGNRILHLLPAQMDPSIASDGTFALCIAFYLERKLGRNSMEKMTVVIDVRGGHGWANPTPKKTYTVY